MAGSEQDLGGLLTDWLLSERWEVYHEVSEGYAGRRADVVATRGPVVAVFELKRSLGLGVMAQAHRWPAHFRWAVVAGRRRQPYDDVLHKVCGALAIGVLEMSEGGWGDRKMADARLIVPAPMLRPPPTALEPLRDLLHDGVRAGAGLAAAGSRGGGHWTPYRDTMLRVRKMLREAPGLSVGEIMERIGEKHHYSRHEGALSGIRAGLQEIEKWCRVDRTSRPFRFYDDQPDEELPRW